MGGAFLCTQAYKPGSVLTAIYLAPRLPAGSSRLLGTAGSACCPSTALLRDRVYSVKPMLPWAGWALTPPFHPYHRRFTHINAPFIASDKGHTICGISSFLSNPHTLGFDRNQVRWRYLSVALVLRLPSAGVTRYPCPVEPGLSSSAAFRLASAAVQPGRGNIVQQGRPIVKCPCKFFWERIYYIMR